jgi:hypothetical protein
MVQHRFYIDTMGNDDEAYREALQTACQLADHFPEITRVILLIGQKGNDGWFERLYGDRVVKSLYAGTKFENCRPLFKFETLRTYTEQYDRQKDIVIGCGTSAENLFKIDDYYCVHTIIAIPWVKQHTQALIDTWRPKDIRSGQEAENNIKEISCVVQKALDDLTGSVNMTTGITHSADNDLAKTYILALHNEGEAMTAEGVRSYLVRHGWDSSYAQDVCDLVETLSSGRHFQGGSRDKKSWKHHIGRWKDECAAQQ